MGASRMNRFAVRIYIASALLGTIALAALPAEASDHEARLAQAASKQDVAVVRSLIQTHADVNAPQNDGTTALLWAAYYSNLDIAKALIAAGATVNTQNRDGMSPLLQAAQLGNAPMVELLLKAGASPKTANPDGETALMAAAGAGSLESVQALLTHGADPKARDFVVNQNALMWASIGGYLPVVQTLLKAGADPNETARVSELATKSAGDSAGRSWVSHPTGGFTALMFAARQGHEDVMKALLDAGAKPSYANPDGLTALMVAVINDRSDLAVELLKRGADANDGSLYEAVQLHNVHVIEQNFDATRPKVWHENKTSPLDLVSAFLEHGADPMRVATYKINVLGVNGGQAGVAQPVNASPWARALQVNDVAIVKLMLAKGANPNAADNGALALSVSLAGGGGARGVFGVRPSPMRFDSERTVEGTVNALLASGAGASMVDRQGATPLHAAAQAGNVPMIDLLVEHGAKLDVKNNAGFTPLDLAMGKGAPAGGRGGPGFGRGGPQPRPEAIAELRKLMGMPPLSPEEMPKAPVRGGM